MEEPRTPFVKFVLGRFRAPFGVASPIYLPDAPMHCAAVLILVTVGTVLWSHWILRPLPDDLVLRAVVFSLTFCDMILMLAAATTEPGIELPARRGEQVVVARSSSEPGEGVAPRSEQFCSVCNQMTPYRGAHSALADVCVRDFDHDCMMINAVIGERSFRYFAFLNYAAFAHSTILLITTARFVHRTFDHRQLIESDVARLQFGVAVPLLIGSFVFSMVSGVLALDATRHAAKGTVAIDRPKPLLGMRFAGDDDSWSFARWKNRLFGSVRASRIAALKGGTDDPFVESKQ